MMKAKFLRLLILSSFVLAGCDNPLDMFKKKDNEPTQQDGEPQGGEQTPGEPSEPETGHFKKTITVKMEALLKGSDNYYNINVDYDDELFLKDAELYDKDLSLLSFGGAISATYESWAKGFLTDAKFENILTHDYDKEPTDTTLGYSLAHKTIDEEELFVVAIRGHEYKREWQNNFLIGKEGDHEGWLARSTELYLELTNYISQYKGGKAIKLWMFGYSRAGAIANALASLVFRGNGFSVDAKKMFVYTFEAPAALTEEHAIKYKNVHNIVNSADIVGHIPPEKYGLYRCGYDYDIYDINFASYVSEFDESIIIPSFYECSPDDFSDIQEPLVNDAELTNYLINDIFSEKSDSSVSAHTRELYVDNYQDGLSYALGMFFALSGTSRSQMMSALSGDYWTVLTILGDETGAALADFLKPYLNQDNISYDDEELVSSCAVLIKAITNLFMKLLAMYMNENYKNDLSRILDMHYPEVTYCLLNQMHSKMAA